ncbi:MAG: hypothetical protein OXH70_17360 [Acidobacteria bacterium]|nr:hypothetical protein [Acidobacteriota bacterium]
MKTLEKDWCKEPIEVQGEPREAWMATTLADWSVGFETREEAEKRVFPNKRFPLLTVARYKTYAKPGQPTGAYFNRYYPRLDDSDSDLSFDLEVVYACPEIGGVKV